MVRMKLKSLIFFFIFNSLWGYSKDIHVSKNGSDFNDGSSQSPYFTISKAASMAIAGDTVFIHGGTYREWVSPENGGINPNRRIVYMSVPGEKVYLKGSEIIKGWTKHKNNVWFTEIDNNFFGAFNPYNTLIKGDWLTSCNKYHLGAVYLNGKIFKEVLNRDELTKQESCWYVEVNDKRTKIFANFGNNDPNKSTVEINVREACFFPRNTGVNYITIKGLNISQASPQWAPPTANQIGMIGPNWSKGWIIENCEISYSKCTGISLGKEYASGQNMWSIYSQTGDFVKHGFNREIEAIIKAYDLGWNKENIGSHLIQNNIIHDCGQSGIVGHLGAVFSTIRNNHIYNINKFTSPKGLETAGIKLHAAIDVKIEHNYIHNTIRGIWLDWQAQGARINGNIIENCDEQDLFIEVSHGPTMIYNNILLSKQSLLIDAQGVACFNNLFKGNIKVRPSQMRYTPYHIPHSTKLKGFFNNSGGDVRFYNNIFLKNNKGLSIYDLYPDYDEHKKNVTNKMGINYFNFKLPVYISNNVYLQQGINYRLENKFVTLDKEDWKLELHKKEQYIDIHFNASNSLLKAIESKSIRSKNLGSTIISEAIFDNTDGSEFVFNTDFWGKERNVNNPVPGPFETIFKGRFDLGNIGIQ